MSDEPTTDLTERPEVTVRRFAGRLVRIEQMVDDEIARIDVADLPCEWWQWRRKHWVDGVGTARAVSLRHLVSIKSAFYGDERTEG